MSGQLHVRVAGRSRLTYKHRQQEQSGALKALIVNSGSAQLRSGIVCFIGVDRDLVKQTKSGGGLSFKRIENGLQGMLDIPSKINSAIRDT